MLKKVKIGGKLRSVKFGMNALRIYSDLTNSTLADLMNVSAMSINNMITLVYVGLQEGSRKEKTEFNHKIEDVSDWLDDDFTNVMNEVMEIFVESFPTIDEKNLEAPKLKGAKKKN